MFNVVSAVALVLGMQFLVVAGAIVAIGAVRKHEKRRSDPRQGASGRHFRS